MTMKLKTRSTHSIDIDGKEYELRLAPDDIYSVVTRKIVHEISVGIYAAAKRAGKMIV